MSSTISLLIFAFIVAILLYIALTKKKKKIPEKPKPFKELIMDEAYKVKEKTGLPASIMAAQAILETGWGEYIPIDVETKKYSYNLFGIKGIGSNGYVNSYTHEYVNGNKIEVLSMFRAYNSYEESFKDYGRFIMENPRYSKALEVKHNPREYIKEIVKAGYATDPAYVGKVLKIAEQCGYL